LQVSYEATNCPPFAPFYPAGIECVRGNHDQSVANPQPDHSAGGLPAKETDQMIKRLVLAVLIALVTLTLPACGPRTTSRALPPEEGAAYAAEVDEYVESYLVGWSECDSAMHRRGFDPEVWEGNLLDESAFQQQCGADRAELGAYQSKTLDHVEDRGDLRVVIYHVEFENDPDVPLVMYFNIDDPDHLIVGVDFKD
jgi:hypothetical protein